MSSLDDLKSTAAELYRLVELTERSRVKDILTIEAKKIETEISRLREQSVGTVLSSSGSKGASAGGRVGCYDVKLSTYAWDQNDSAVKVYITLPKVETLPPEKIYCDFNETSFTAHINELDGKNYVLNIGFLHSPVQVETCSWKVKTGMVVVTLPKMKKETWADLNKVESKIMLKKPPKMEESGDPGSGIMNLMKQMYDEGDDDMKRTISKAWYESREKNMGMGMGM